MVYKEMKYSGIFTAFPTSIHAQLQGRIQYIPSPESIAGRTHSHSNGSGSYLPENGFPVYEGYIYPSVVRGFIVHYPVIVLPQGRRTEKGIKHKPVLDFGKTGNVRNPAVLTLYPQQCLGDCVAFCIKPSLCPPSSTERGKLPVRVILSAVGVIKEILEIPEHEQQRVPWFPGLSHARHCG